MADWSLAGGVPNFAQAALSGYQAGQSVGRQKQLDAALGGIDLNRPETLLPILRADPSTGAALIGASVKLHAEARAQQAQDAISNAFNQATGNPSSSSGSSSTTASTPAPTPPSITATPTPANPLDPNGAATPPGGDVVVTAPHPITQMPPTLQQTVGKLIAAGVPLDQATQFVDLAGKMTKTQADALSDQQDALSSVATSIPKNLSLDQRTAWVQSHKDFLLAHNVPEAKIDSFVPTDENIQSVQTLALGTKDALTQAREAAAQAETVRQHGIENSMRQQGLGIEARNSDISAAHLGIDRAQLGLPQAKFKQTSGLGSNAGGIATPTNAAQYNALPTGSRYYKNGQVFVKGGGQ